MSSVHEVGQDGVVVVSEEITPEELQISLSGGIGEQIDRFPFGEKVRKALASWAEDAQGGSTRRTAALFGRDRYVTPGRITSQMAMAYDALDDDIVGGIADISEALVFQKVNFESDDDEDQEDIWAQIGRDLDLDSYLRMAWRELYTTSQFYGVKWWGQKTYTPRGKRKERDKRKSFDLVVPVRLGMLDPTRVVPVQNDLFGRSQLAWVGTNTDFKLIKVDGDMPPDPLVQALFVGKYDPSEKEKADLEREGIPTDNLILLNPDFVFRHTLTKSPFERWARIRMKSIFPLLDLKHNLREMDRAFLLGSVNFIVLVTRGTDLKPATSAEVNATAEQIRVQSRQPIIVTDHRIEITIITPDVTNVLAYEKWNVIDERIMMKLWGTFQLPSKTAAGEDSVTLGKVIARGLVSRRHMIKRTLEKELIKAVLDNPANKAAGFDSETSLEFTPRRIELELDAAVIGFIQELRDRGDLSRETILSEVGYDQGIEHRRRVNEAKVYDKDFKPVQVPFDSPAKLGAPGASPSATGRKGGRPPGATTAPAKKAAAKPAKAEEIVEVESLEELTEE